MSVSKGFTGLGNGDITGKVHKGPQTRIPGREKEEKHYGPEDVDQFLQPENNKAILEKTEIKDVSGKGGERNKIIGPHGCARFSR